MIWQFYVGADWLLRTTHTNDCAVGTCMVARKAALAPCLTTVYCGLIPAVLMTFVQLVISDAVKSA